jgi:hypothetical protein
MTRVQYAPGLTFQVVNPPAEPSPLRSDVAGFVGRTKRGPVGEATRVTGWREYALTFGGLLPDANAPLSLQGYFDNGGDVAYVVRLLGPARSGNPADLVASATWDLTRLDGDSPPLQGWNPVSAGFPAATLGIVATSPGVWAKGLRVSPRYRQEGASGRAEIDVVVRVSGELTEYMIGLDPVHIIDQVEQRSRLIRIISPGSATGASVAAGQPRLVQWKDVVLTLKLSETAELGVSQDLYQAALQLLLDQEEVALIVLPDLLSDLPLDQAKAIQYAAIAGADPLHDRIALLDLPFSNQDSVGAAKWSTGVRNADLGNALRSAAAYHPWLNVQEPFGGTVNPLRSIPPCGHVAGVISRLDRERGAQYTPANASVADAMDVTTAFTQAERAALNEAGINVLRCVPGKGIQVWGGRTIYPDPYQQEPGKLFIAHRRLIHRLVRAIKRVAEPLVFETNGPVLWLTLSRAITTVLVEAYRAGGLKGSRPEEAFQVRCDAMNNPPDEIDRGEVLCEVDLAPAVPMEFITLRVSLSVAGSLDVFEN